MKLLRTWGLLGGLLAWVWGCQNSPSAVIQVEPANLPSSTSSMVEANAPPESLREIWQSPQACQSYFKTRPVRDPVPRIATWNLRWFPDGTPEAKPSGGTDLNWLACVLSSLELDVVAVQEVKRTALAQQAMTQLLGALKQLSGATYALELDRCPLDDDAHVGFLYNTARVSIAKLQDYPSLNPYGVSCEGRLRTGFGGYVKIAGGPDLSLLSVHLKSGPDQRSYTLRRRSLAGMKDVFANANAAQPDGDVLVLGDFNTMGCEDCAPLITGADEREVLAGELGALVPRFHRLPTDLSCSEYYANGPSLLDHIVAAEPFEEFPKDGRATVSGYCAEAKCAAFSTPPAAYTALSDHCPIVMELAAEDRD
ncbi:MAG: endonuclease/exonuclease/phosphatase family protein [Polyangiaceae bacterium]|nr:endonuclease/exonuclease/phosphatase family protein [Polyangiaceae bacterium]